MQCLSHRASFTKPCSSSAHRRASLAMAIHCSLPIVCVMFLTGSSPLLLLLSSLLSSSLLLSRSSVGWGVVVVVRCTWLHISSLHRVFGRPGRRLASSRVSSVGSHLNAIVIQSLPDVNASFPAHLHFLRRWVVIQSSSLSLFIFVSAS